MPIEIIPLGGFFEIGKNCVAIKADDEVVILDIGLHMENYINHTDREDIVDKSLKTLIKEEAVPDIRKINDLADKVVAICIGHAHLDHVGAVPYIANKFNCPIYGSPFTMEVLKTILTDERIDINNELIGKKVDSSFKVSKNITVEFINATHSTPQSVFIAVHTKYGTVLYANDYKWDETPTLGKKPNERRLKELNVKVLIINCLYATNYASTSSEAFAKEQLREILLESDNEGKNIFLSTFSSHISRLKTIAEFGRKMGRKVVFMGRSLGKYSLAAERAKVTKFENVEIIKYGNKIKSFLMNVKKSQKYLFVMTGHQGEPKAALSKIVYQNLFKFKPGDKMIFSCQIIPVEDNIINRERLEKALKEKHVKIYSDVHVSGHASREDHRKFINLIRPECIIPLHGDEPRMNSMKELAEEENIKSVYLLRNGERKQIK